MSKSMFDHGPNTRELSAAQRRFLQKCLDNGFNETPSCGRPDSGREVSAWYRTARGLQRRGFVTLERCGDHQKAFVTLAGAAEMERQ